MSQSHEVASLQRCVRAEALERPTGRESEWFVRLRLYIPSSPAGVSVPSDPDAGHLIAQSPPEDKRWSPYATLQCPRPTDARNGFKLT